MVVTISGLLALVFAFNTQQRTPGVVGWLAAILAVAALALYGVLQAVDGVALKRAVDAWVSAPEAEKAARFASAEAIRWLEEGLRSYQDILPGLANIFLAIMVVEAPSSLQPIGYLMGCPESPTLHRALCLASKAFRGSKR